MSLRIAMLKVRDPLKRRALRKKYISYRPKTLGHLCTYNQAKKPLFFFNVKELEALAASYKKHYPVESDATIKTAKLICEHKFKWLSPNCPDFDDAIDWHSNFLDSRRWPLDFYQDLDYTSPERIGDIRQVWELNRHQYLVVLCKAFWLTGDETYAIEALAQISDWIDKNPVGYGINWIHSQEIALRAVSWTWLYQFLGHHASFDGKFEEIFLQGIYQHAEFINTHLSDKPVTHNHLISECCGLALVGLMYPQFRDSGKWFNTGLRIFFREVIKQIWEDGLDAELSTNYHCFVLDSFLQLYILLLKNEIPVPDGVAKRIEKMIEAVMYLLRPDGTLPLIGDCDSGRAFRLNESAPWDRRSYLSIGATLYERSDFKFVATTFHEEAFWLLGVSGLQKFNHLNSTTPAKTDRVFAQGGFASFRESWKADSGFLLIKGGATQTRRNVGISHNHSDLLSFEFYDDGRKLLVDPGVYLYGEDDGWRFFYRKTLAHNTIVIDDVDQIDVTAMRFGIPSLPLSILHDFRYDESCVLFDMAHSAYSCHGLGHRRKFIWLKNECLIIVDLLSGEGSHKVEQYFHFSQGLTLRLEGTKISSLDEKGKILTNLFLISDTSNKLTAELFYGEAPVLQGWVSDRYAQKDPAGVLRVFYQGEVPIELITVITKQNDIEEDVIKQKVRDISGGENDNL